MRHNTLTKEQKKDWVGKKTLDRMMQIAYDDGIRHSDCKPALRRFVDYVWFKTKKPNQIRIHGEVIFLFHNETLITVYRIDSKNLKKVKHTKEYIDTMKEMAEEAMTQ